MPFFSVAVTRSPVARRSAAGAVLRGEGSEQMWPLQQCCLVFSIVQRLWTWERSRPQRCCPAQKTPGAVCSGFASISRSSPGSSLSQPARTLIPLCHLHGPVAQGVRLAGQRESGRQTGVIPALFDYLLLRSNAQALQGTKNPIAVCCPQLEAHPKHLVQL